MMRLSLATAFVVILFIGLFVMAADTVKDPDFWWHLRAGEYIAENHIIPKTDPSFAYTTAGKQWSTHEWLSEVFIWKAYESIGLPGLSLFFAALITFAYALVFLRSPGKPYFAGFAVLLGALASLPLWNVRPQMFTLFFLSLLIFLLERYFEKPTASILIALPVMILLWVNLHGGFLLGIMVIFAYLLGKSIELLARERTGDDSPSAFAGQDLLRLAGIFILCLIASGVNPSAYRIYAFPLGTLSSPAIQRYITEWFSPNFHEVDWVPLALLLLGIMALGLFVRRRFKFTTIGLLTVSAYASLRTVRNVPLFSVIAAPVMASQLSSIVTLQPSTENIPRRTRMTLAILLAVIALVGAALVWLRLSDQPKTDRATFPVGAVDWIEIHQPEGNLFNAYQWGGYLIWRLYPHYPVFIDGRAELHGDQMLTEYVNIYNTHSGWEQDLEHYGVGVVLVEPNSLIAQRLTESAHWEKVYADKTSALFVRR